MEKGPKKELSLFDSTCIIVGIIIGASEGAVVAFKAYLSRPRIFIPDNKHFAIMKKFKKFHRGKYF